MRRTQVIDPANQCDRCPHEVIALPRTGTLFCPCEDCHPGGRIQGRVYTHEPVARTTTITEEDPLWVDPIHSLKETAQ